MISRLLNFQRSRTGEDPLTRIWWDRCSRNCPQAATTTGLVGMLQLRPYVDTYLKAQRAAGALPAYAEDKMDAQYWPLVGGAFTFTATFTKTGETLRWVVDDGTTQETNTPSQVIAASTTSDPYHTTVISYDGFASVTGIAGDDCKLYGIMPIFTRWSGLTSLSFARCALTLLPDVDSPPALVTFDVRSNTNCAGTIRSLANSPNLTTLYAFSCAFTAMSEITSNTKLETIRIGTNSGLTQFKSCAGLTKLTSIRGDVCAITSLTSFAGCTGAITIFNFTSNRLTTLPLDMNEMVNATSIWAPNNAFTTYTPGTLTTQILATSIQLHNSGAPASFVNAVLADCVVNEAARPGSSPNCTLLIGGTTNPNAAPTGQGILDKATLVAAGWTVTTTP